MYTRIFRMPLEQTYYELINIITSQNYIEEFIMFDTEDIKDVENKFCNIINLSAWRTSNDLYNKNWIEIFTNYYSLKNINLDIKWLIHDKKDDKYKDTIFIHHNKLNINPIITNLLLKNNCTFITCNINEYNNSPYKNYVNSCLLCNDLDDLITSINSCKFFIGSQSSPIAIAYALGINCLAELYIPESIHYIGMEYYNKNFSWILNDKISDNFIFNNNIKK